jgi:diaminopimelate decarboxylase
MSELVSNRSGVLEIEGVSAETLANRFGTPLYVYSAQTIRRRYQALESAFKKREVLLCYA